MNNTEQELESSQQLLLRLLRRQRETDDADAMIADACQALGRFLKTDRVGFYEIVDSESLRFAISWTDGKLPEMTGIWLFSDYGEGYLKALRAGTTVAIDDVANHPQTRSGRLSQVGAGALIGAPILRSGRWRAGMYVNEHNTRQWRQAEVDLAREVADQTWDAVERARATWALRQSEDNLRNLNRELERLVAERTAELNRVWQNSRDLFIVLDGFGVLRSVNPAAMRILGRKPEESVGKGLQEFVWHEDLEHAQAGLLTAITEHDLTDFETRLVHMDGSLRWISWRTSKENDLIYGYGRDITAEKLQSRALRHAEESLRQAQKMEAVGQLTGGIAHDFNNMLAVVSGSLDLLNRRIGATDPIAKRFVDAAQDGTQRAATLTKRLLSFSRQNPLKLEPIDINALLDGMSELLRRSLGPQIHLQVMSSDAVWPIHSDVSQIENVILNIALNARDAMPDGGTLALRAANMVFESTVQPNSGAPLVGDFVMLEIADTGIGMSQAVVDKVFEPFYTTKPVGKGTGLGLSQVYGYVQQSKGHVTITSKEGEGTCVRIYLPRTDLFPTILPTESAHPADRTSAIILVVDDEVGVRRFSVDALQEIGYRVVEAENAAHALELLQANVDISVLFTDIVMPDMNGWKLAEAARRARPDLKVLYTSGYNPDGYGDKVVAGATLLPKPFSIDQLSTNIARVISDRSGK